MRARSEHERCDSNINNIFGSFTSSLHAYTQSALGVNGSEPQAETGAKGECGSANMSNEAPVMLKAGVLLPWCDPELVPLGLNMVRARKPLTILRNECYDEG